MEQLFQLRMQDHELTMRKMIEEIHRGVLNIEQAAVKFEVTRKTVRHWLNKVENEAEKTLNETAHRSTKGKGKSSKKPDQTAVQVQDLLAKVRSLEEELQASKFTALYYSSLVKVAEQELGIDIEKKSVTKQWRGHRPVHEGELSKHSYSATGEIACCSTAGFTRQGYYQYWQRQASEVNWEDQIIQLVKQVRKDHPCIGGRKLYQLLKPDMSREGVKIGRDAFFNLLSMHQLLIRKRRRKIATTMSRHRFKKYPNLIKSLVIERPNQVWVSAAVELTLPTGLQTMHAFIFL